ncbi:hypothetical protein [Wolbachia endosymbiont (group A) of Agelastica alni]
MSGHWDDRGRYRLVSQQENYKNWILSCIVKSKNTSYSYPV